MNAVVPWLLLVALVALLVAHVAIAAGFVAQRAYKRAAIALFVIPLAPYWGWRNGHRVRVIVWLAGLGLYAFGVAIA